MLDFFLRAYYYNFCKFVSSLYLWLLTKGTGYSLQHNGRRVYWYCDSKAGQDAAVIMLMASWIVIKNRRDEYAEQKRQLIY